MKLIYRVVVVLIVTGMTTFGGYAAQLTNTRPGNQDFYAVQADTADSAATDSTREKENGELPLEPERTISFTTTEGSWISVDVSPDGQTIAFDLMGDIYTIPIEGGEATRITEGMAYDTHPRYSPDGR